MPFLTFYITHPDEATARHITSRLLTDRWIACANIFPVSSQYWWDRQLQNDSEWVSVVKTSLALEKHLESIVQQLHPYEVPCIMRFETRANEAYEQWISDMVRAMPESG